MGSSERDVSLLSKKEWEKLGCRCGQVFRVFRRRQPNEDIESYG